MHFSIRRRDKQNKKAASFLLSTYSEHMHIQEQVSVYNCIPRDTVFDTEDEARVFLLSLGGGPSTVIVSNHDVAVFTNHTSRKMVRREHPFAIYIHDHATSGDFCPSQN